MFSEIKLNEHPNTLIIGHNGSGKSTLLDALTFVLFGKAFRKVNKSGLVNSINNKDCRVEIEFTSNNKDYKIIRGMKPNIFEVYCDGILLNQDSVSKDYQDNLESFILRMNYKSFTQIVILGSASFTPFMQLSASDRRTVIEDLLDIQIFTVMNNITKQRLVDNKAKIEKNKIESLGKTDTRNHIMKVVDGLRKNDEQRVKDLKEEIERNEKVIQSIDRQISKLNKEYRTILDSTQEYKNLKTRYTKLISLKSQIETNHSRHSNDLEFYTDNDNCPTCKQSIEAGFKSTEIEKLTGKLSELSGGINKIVSEIDSCLSQIEIIDNKMKDAEEIRNQISEKEIKRNHISSNITKFQENIKTISNSNELLESNLSDLKKIEQDIEKIEKENKQLLDEKLVIDTALTLLKDGGIKTKIIKQYIPIINKLINKNLSNMNFMVNFNIDEQFNETIKSRYRDDFAYQNFSEGEKTRIDLALLFTWREIAKMKNSVTTNLLILDEIFDGSLDETGTDDFVKIMWSLIKDSNVFVISHKQDQMVDKFKKVYTFKKKKNFSVISK